MPRRSIARPRAKPRYFKAVKRAGGRVAYKWEPGPTLRDSGWQAVDLGDDLSKAVAAAEERNEAVAAWRAGAVADAKATEAIKPADNRHATMGDLLDRFNGPDGLQGISYKTNKPYSLKTQTEYRSRMKFLRAWTNDGAMKLRHITPETVTDLRNTLVRNATPNTAAGILRVLSVVMGWAEHVGMIPRGSDPAKRLNIPAPDSRRKRVQPEVVDAISAAAIAKGWPSIALAVRLGFYMVQRPGDLRGLTEFNWRKATDIAPHDRAVLAGPDGHVWSFRLKQQKTGAWVDLAVPSDIRVAVEATINEQRRKAHAGDPSPAPILFDHSTGGRWHERNFSKYIRMAINHALELARKDQNEFMIDQLTGLQFRDLRRSGMCWMRDLGVPVPLIAARSGHSIQETQKILDTYMPADSRGSAAAIAMATTRAAEIAQQKENEG